LSNNGKYAQLWQLQSKDTSKQQSWNLN
jgi:hypothetical protein